MTAESSQVPHSVVVSPHRRLGYPDDVKLPEQTASVGLADGAGMQHVIRTTANLTNERQCNREGVVVWCRKHQCYIGESIAAADCAGCPDWQGTVRHDVGIAT